MIIETFGRYSGSRSRFTTPAPAPTTTPLGSEPKSPFTQIQVGSDSFVIVRPQFPTQKFEIKFSDNQRLKTNITTPEGARRLDDALVRAFTPFKSVEMGSDLLLQVVEKFVASFS